MNEADFQRLLDASSAEMRKHVDNAAAETRKHVDGTVAEIRKHVDSTAADTRNYVESTATELRKHVDATAVDTRNYVDSTAAETRRHFDITAEHLNGKIQLVVETVALLDAKVDRVTESIRDEMRRGFADTQAMIKFSHAELDRRVRTLESDVASLQMRVERLETSTH